MASNHKYSFYSVVSGILRAVLLFAFAAVVLPFMLLVTCVIWATMFPIYRSPRKFKKHVSELFTELLGWIFEIIRDDMFVFYEED